MKKTKKTYISKDCKEKIEKQKISEYQAYQVLIARYLPTDTLQEICKSIREKGK